MVVVQAVASAHVVTAVGAVAAVDVEPPQRRLGARGAERVDDGDGNGLSELDGPGGDDGREARDFTRSDDGVRRLRVGGASKASIALYTHATALRQP